MFRFPVVNAYAIHLDAGFVVIDTGPRVPSPEPSESLPSLSADPDGADGPGVEKSC